VLLGLYSHFFSSSSVLLSTLPFLKFLKSVKRKAQSGVRTWDVSMTLAFPGLQIGKPVRNRSCVKDKKSEKEEEMRGKRVSCVSV